MPRTGRQVHGGTVFHVLNRGVGRMRLFEIDGDYEAFGRRAGWVSEANGRASPPVKPAGTLASDGRPAPAGVSTMRTTRGDIDEVVQMQRNTSDYFYHHDDQYNVTAITDANGAVAERYDYGDFGEPIVYDAGYIVRAASAVEIPFTSWFMFGDLCQPKSGLDGPAPV